MPDRLGAHKPGAVRAAAIVVALFAVVAGVVITLGLERGRYAWDAIVYHEPAIILMSRDMPAPDVSNYFSATTPGYHYVMACARWAGVESTGALRSISALITAAWIATLAAAAARRAGPALAVALTLPVLGSMYALMPGVFLLPDNLGWLMITSLLLVKISRSESPRGIVFAAALVACAVLVKQVHIWTAAVVWAGAWTNAAGEVAPSARKLKRGLFALGLTLPAFAILGWFINLWGGLSPPRFQSDIQGVAPSLPAFLLVQIAVLTPFFALPVLGDLVRAARDNLGWVVGAALVGVVLVLVPDTTLSVPEGRYSGYWRLTTLAPELFGRTSSAFLVLAPAGAAALVAWGFAMPGRTRVVLGVALLAFCAAHAASINVWQRYHEPMLLILMILSVAEIRREHPREAPRWRLAGPLAAALLMGAHTALNVSRSAPVEPGPLPENHRAPGDPTPPYAQAPIHPIGNARPIGEDTPTREHQPGRPRTVPSPVRAG